jgi:hypothetical protein
VPEAAANKESLHVALSLRCRPITSPRESRRRRRTNKSLQTGIDSQRTWKSFCSTANPRHHSPPWPQQRGEVFMGCFLARCGLPFGWRCHTSTSVTSIMATLRVDLFGCLNPAGNRHDQRWLRMAICPLSDGSVRQKQRNHRSLLSVNQVRAGFTGQRQANDHRRSRLISVIISCTFTSFGRVIQSNPAHTDRHDFTPTFMATAYPPLHLAFVRWRAGSSCGLPNLAFVGRATGAIRYLQPRRTVAGWHHHQPGPTLFEAHRQLT